MNRLFSLCLFLLLVSCRPPTSPPTPLAPQPLLATSQGTWRLTFQDEFSAAPLDTLTWNTDLFGSRTNGTELQYYDEAVGGTDGKINLVARKLTAHGKDYQSGVLTTLGKVELQYGFVEARVKVPRGNGLWPAFWMYDAKTGSAAEIDILELLGEAPTRAYQTLHFDGTGGTNQSVGSHFDAIDFSQDFHVFGVDWEPDKVLWYIDGVERFRVTDHVPTVPLYLILNLAVGGSWPMAPDDPSVFPATFSVDWVRVYQRS